MIAIPQSTVEKPLTTIDYIACLAQCVSVAEVASYGEGCPEGVRADERFTRAVAARLADLKDKRAVA